MADYRMLFNVKIEHTYFLNKEFKHIGFEPLLQTQKLIKNANLLITMSADSICLFYDHDVLDVLLACLEDLTEYEIAFKLRCTDTCFQNYTNLEFNSESCLCFENFSKTKQEGEITLLHENEIVSNTEIKPLSSVNFDYILAPKDRNLSPFGTLNIKLSDAKNNKNAIINSKGKIIPQRYVIRFGNRSIKWRYHLISTNADLFEKVYIEDEQHAILFSEPEEITLSNGTVALMTESKLPLLLEEHSNYTFQLKGIQNKLKRTLLKKIETPDIQSISGDNTHLFSQTYIYY